MRAKITGFVIVVFWVVMMGTLVRRYLPGGSSASGAPPLDTATLADSWRDSEEWMELRWNKVAIGVMRTTARRLAPATAGEGAAEKENPGETKESRDSSQGEELATKGTEGTKETDEERNAGNLGNARTRGEGPDAESPAGLTPPAGSTSPVDSPTPSDPKAPKDRFQVAVLIGIQFGPFQARTSTSALLNERLILDQFSLRLSIGRGGEGEFRVDGVARGTNLFVRIARGDSRQFNTVKLAHPVSLAEGLAPLYSRSDLKVGDTYTLPVFDPVWNMQGGNLTVHVAKEEDLRIDNKSVDTLRVETTMGNVKTTTWVDRDGNVWKREIPPLEMVAIDPALAMKRQPWMAELPPPPHLRAEDMQGEDRGEPLGSNGLLGLFRGALQGQGASQSPSGGSPASAPTPSVPAPSPSPTSTP